MKTKHVYTDKAENPLNLIYFKPSRQDVRGVKLYAFFAPFFIERHALNM